MDFNINDEECQIINFTDITAYRKLEQEEQANRILKTLIASVHHELLVPVKASIDIAERLLVKMKSFV